MSTQAIALLRIPAKDLPDGLEVTALKDGALLSTGLEMRETEPEEIALSLRDTLGELLDRHDDARGVLLLPSAAKPTADSYDAVVAEVGELGEWVAVPEEAPPMDLAAMAGQMMGQFGPQMAALQEQLMRDPAAMQAAMAQATALLGNPAALSEAAKAFGLGGMDLGAMAAQAQAFLKENPGALNGMAPPVPDTDDEDDDPAKKP